MIGVVISRFALADASRFVKGELPADSYLSDSVEIMAGPRGQKGQLIDTALLIQ